MGDINSEVDNVYDFLSLDDEENYAQEIQNTNKHGKRATFDNDNLDFNRLRD